VFVKFWTSANVGMEALSLVRSASIAWVDLDGIKRSNLRGQIDLGGVCELPNMPPMLIALRNLLMSFWKLVISVDMVPVMSRWTCS